MSRLWPLLGLLLLAACVAAPAPRTPLQGRNVLIFSHTTGYRHDSIQVGAPALAALVRQGGGQAVHSEDPNVFASGGLARFDAIIFLSSTTDPQRPESEWLTGARREGLRAFVRRGGGIVGIHAGSDSHYHWPYYGQLIGGRFARHPPGTPAGRLSVVDRRHPATAQLPSRIDHVDEYYFLKDIQPGSQLLLTLDPASIGEPGLASPISWAREHDGGRVFYTALGHTSETYSAPFFLAHVRGGLEWVLAGRAPL